jgi:cytosine/adenosine deaminase-related metal-dependent hydrolase
VHHQHPTGKREIISAQWVIPVNQPPIYEGYIAVESGKIVGVGSCRDLPYCPPIHAGTLITPGLINAHMHLEQSFPEAIEKDATEPFTAWLLRVVERMQRENESAQKLQRVLQGVEELLSTGTTCVNDIASGPESLQGLQQAGLRGIVSLEVFHPAAAPVNISSWISRYQALQAMLKDFPESSRLQLGLSPHSPYNVSPNAWRALVDACQPVLVHSHLAEFADEALYLQGQPSSLPFLHQTLLGQAFKPQALAASPVRYLQQFGLLQKNSAFAHLIETDAKDRQLLAESGAGIVHCPRSNMDLHGKTLAAQDWAETGIPLALGTDGRLSTADLDLRAEARLAMSLHGWNAEQALAAMTRQGARVLQMEHLTGTLSSGLSADYVLWQAPDSVASEPECAVLQPETRVREVVIEGQTRWLRGSIHDTKITSLVQTESRVICPVSAADHPAADLCGTER